MPQLSPLIISALIGAGTTGVTTGLEASGAIGGGSSGPSAADQQKLLDIQNQKSQQSQEIQAFRHAAPDLQNQTGGSLSDSSFSSMIAELSGSPSDTNLAQQTIFGTTPGLSSGGGGS